MERFLKGLGEDGIVLNPALVKEYLDRFDPDRHTADLIAAFPGLPSPQYYSHHQSHAASAYFYSGFTDALTIVMDGSGEDVSTSVYIGSGSRLEMHAEIKVPHSLGHFFQAITEYLGYTPHRDEGTIMALSSLGEPDARLKALMEEVVHGGRLGYRINPSLVSKPIVNDDGSNRRSVYTGEFAQRLEALGIPVGAARSSVEPVFQSAADLTRAAQGRLHAVVLDLAREHLSLTGCRSLCLSGGVALNCQLNGHILHTLVVEGWIDRFFVQPVSHDAGAALGAAALAWVSNSKSTWKPVKLRSLALGPSFDRTQVENALRFAGVGFRNLNGQWREIAERIDDGDVVAVFSGAMEFGPRALGHRSILASPKSRELTQRLNQIKLREWFRPACPSLFHNSVIRIPFTEVYEPEHMIVAYDATPAEVAVLPGAFHIDSTFRPQLVAPSSTNHLGQILNALRSTGRPPVVLNTSFNVREPLVCTPGDAVRTFLNSEIDALVIEGLLVPNPNTKR
jgi:carbamoyltransferase